MSDIELVKLAQAGNSTAMEELLDRYKPLVRARSAEFFMPGSDREDVIQEGMIGLFKAIRTYKTDSRLPFASFAATCIQSQIIDAVRGAARLKHEPLNQSLSLQALTSQAQTSSQNLIDTVADTQRFDPEQEMIGKETKADLQGFLTSELSPLELDSVQLFILGKNYQEIAATLGVGVKSVDNALQRARRKFAAKFNESSS
jgi:RNA polymerase sporulation-specific sigma factor